MITPSIQPIFPIPICMSKLDREFTKEEKAFFAKQNSKQQRNIGNTMSSNNYILNEEEMAGLKVEIEDVLNQYMQNIVCPEDPSIQIYITQSWMNWTRPGEWHHKHTHSNSYLSGVFYVDAEKGVDKIVFFNDIYRTIKINASEINHFNAETWDFQTETGMLVIFPSWLQHMVEMKTQSHKNTRISLAFNTFLRGTLGKRSALTELKL